MCGHCVASLSSRLHFFCNYFEVQTFNGFVQLIIARDTILLEMQQEDVIHKLSDGYIPL